MRPGAGDGLVDLYATYADLLDGGELDEWLALFTPDGHYAVIPRENHERGLPLAAMRCESRDMLADRVHALRSLSVYRPRAIRHLIGAPRVVGGGDGQWNVRANYAVFESVAGAPATVASTGRYHDIVVATPAGLRLREKVCVYDAAVIETSMVFPL